MQKIEKKIGYKFKNKKLLNWALTHSTFASENFYERLEFLGDLILDAVVGIYIFKKYKNKDEEFLTNLKSAYVNRNYLKKISDKMEIIKFTKYKGQKPKRTDRILESIIGAIYLDGGWRNVEKFIKKFILNIELEPLKNYKNLIFNYAIKNHNVNPVYTVVKIEGLPHKRKFEVKVKIKGVKYVGRGKGNSLKEAEIKSAKDLYEKLIRKYRTI
ncbi:MAG: putative dsRNA-binding protein [Candidatus Omnitrophica bacterium]|nr:putative dsRNA-binding protein [Candidatus Omnitrophota bacterium]